MSRGYAGHDEQGRPIVAELGRAETPEEIAARRAATSKAHGQDKSVWGLVGALVGSVAIIALLVMVVVRPDQSSMRDTVDYAAETATAQSVYDNQLVVPQLPETWSSNFARTAHGSGGVRSWDMGFVTADREFVQLVQAFNANPGWLDDMVAEAEPGAVVSLGGVNWTSYDRRDADNVGNIAYALVAAVGERTVVISGTADDADFITLATATAEELQK